MKLRTWNAFELKLFMALLMVLDHLDHIPGLLPPELSALFHAATRCVGVWFAYLVVEGFLYTRSRLRYNLRLFGWAAVMALGNQLYNLLAAGKGLTLSNNIFFTLALGVLMLNLLAGAQPDAPLWQRALRIVGGCAVLFAGLICAEGGPVILPFILITYYFRGRPLVRNIVYLGFSLLLFFSAFHLYPTLRETLLMLGFNSDFLFISVLPFIALYNGQRGPNTPFAKYFFYVFYPLHLWIIGVIALIAA